MDPPSLALVETWLDRLYIGVAGATLRKEDRKKAVEIAALLEEVARALPHKSRSRRVPVVVDAAAGKAYVGLLAAQLVLAPAGRRARIVAVERDAARTQACRVAAGKLEAPSVEVEVVRADLGAGTPWPEEPELVVALHACGAASDLVLDAAISTRARRLLLVPCCTGRSVAGASRAESAANGLGWPRHAPVRRAFAEAWIAAERTLRLEAAGYETEVVPFVPPTVTPYNLLWRARRVGEPTRMECARASLERLQR